MLIGLLLLPIPSVSLDVALPALAVVAVLCRIFGTHACLKWPIFMVLMLLLQIDALLYAVVRLLIKLCTQRSERSLEDARDYESWLTAARAADAEEGRDAWKLIDESRDYDWRSVKAMTERLRVARESGDAQSLMTLLLLALKNNAFGELEYDLYTHTRVGTKTILELYRDEVCESLRFLGRERPEAGSLAFKARREFCLAARASLGSTALVLSGGATFGIFHFGTVKGLVDLGLLPPIICGASAGAVVASVACTRSDEELKQVLADQTDLFREMGPGGPLHGSLFWKLQQILKHGRIYNADDFQRHMHWFAMGLTFREAFEKTGRVLTISATPVRSRGRRAVPMQLNYISTPHVDIASAVCASACVPGLIDPVELLEKDPIDGSLRPYHFPDADTGARIRLRDGSFESDVPLQALAATFGATFTIVSQTNPHVVPFYSFLQGRAGRPSGGRDRTGAWRGGFLLGSLEVALKEDMRTHLRVLRTLQLGRALFGVDWSNLWLQTGTGPQDGSVVLTPSLSLTNWTYVLSNLEQPHELASMIAQMERGAWEASSLIRGRLDVQKALDDCADQYVPSTTGNGSPQAYERVPSKRHHAAALQAAVARAEEQEAPPLRDAAAAARAGRARASPARRHATAATAK